MKKFYVIFVFVIFLFGCKDNPQEESFFDSEETKEEITTVSEEDLTDVYSGDISKGDPFFDFDEVVHYSNPAIDYNSIIRNSKKDNTDDKLLLEIVLGDYPKKKIR